MLPKTVPAADELYRALLELSAEAIARFELTPPLRVDGSMDEQVEAVLHHARVVECNDAYAALYGRVPADMLALPLDQFAPAGPQRGIVEQFVRGGYRLAEAEVRHDLPDGSTRWVSGNALGLVEGRFLHGYWVTLHDITARKHEEVERERRDDILEAVAFGAARLFEPGSWASHAGDVLARLGEATSAARAWLAETVTDADGLPGFVFRATWGLPGHKIELDHPLIRGGISYRKAGFAAPAEELAAGRPAVGRVDSLPEDSLPTRMGSKAFVATPIFVAGKWWGFLGFGETRYHREWSTPEIEALKAAAAVFAAAIERDRADRVLQESEERFKRLAAAAFEGIAITEAGVFIDANDQMARMLDTPDLIGKPVRDFVAVEDRGLVESHLKSGSEEPYQHSARRRDGSTFPVEIRARRLPFEGRTLRVTAIRDMSERVEAAERQRQLEGALRNAADQWRQTFDALDLAIVLADPQTRIVRLNRAALDLAARPSFTDAIGRTLDDLADEEPWRSVLDLHARISASGASGVAEARDPSTRRSFYLLGSPWFRIAGEPPWCILTFRDVTPYTTMQGQLRRARTLEAMGSLVAGVAHEVRNPLFSISATVDALESEFGQRAEFGDYFPLLRSQVGRLTQLMRDLLEYGKPSVLRRGPTRLADVVRRAIRSCAALARERQVRVEEAVDGELPTLEIESARVEQALENLLANAIQHAPAGSAVRIGACLDTAGGAPAARCTVDDDGSGIALKDLEHVFEPFFSRRKGGTGLGLPIVQRVAEAHGGSVTAENRAEGGARFTLLLPVAPGAPEGRTLG